MLAGLPHGQPGPLKLLDVISHLLDLACSHFKLTVLQCCLLGKIGDVGVRTLLLLEEVLFDLLKAILPVLVALL